MRLRNVVSPSCPLRTCCLLILIWSGCISVSHGEEVTLAVHGEAKLPIYVVGVAPPPAKKSKIPPAWLTAESRVHDALPDLLRCMDRMTRAQFTLKFAETRPDVPSILIGTPQNLGLSDVKLEREEFVLRSHGGSLYVAAVTEVGMSHAIYALLERCGCRWYFPGELWEVIPEVPKLVIDVNEVQRPDLPDVRLCVFVYANKSRTIRQDTSNWNRRNRMVNYLNASTSHVWCGLDRQKDFEAHPEWFGLTAYPDGVRARKSWKPCYSHPDVVARGVQYARDYFRKTPNAAMVPVTPPDDPGFCECERCLKNAGVTNTTLKLDTLFGRNANGDEVSVPSENVYRFANEIARVVAHEFPGKKVGVGAYSGYAHPPSFRLEPNVYVSVTSGYRRTPLTPDQQIATFGKKANSLAIYEYYDVINWDFDQPGRPRASQLDYLAGSTRFYHQQGATGLKGEASNNWAVAGIGYYALSKLMWNTKTDVRKLEQEFFHQAFGPAADSMKRFYHRWEVDNEVTPLALAGAYRDLQEAADLVAGQEPFCTRVDRLRMYAHFLHTQFIRSRPRPDLVALWKQRYGEEGAKQKLHEFGTLVSRLMDTGVIQSYAFNEFIELAGKELGTETSQYRQPGDIPTAAEVQSWFEQDRAVLPQPAKTEPEWRLYSKELVPLGNGTTIASRPIEAGFFSTATIYVWAQKGETVRFDFRLGNFPDGVSDEVLSTQFISRLAFQADQSMAARKADKVKMTPQVQFLAESTGFYQINWQNASLTSSTHPFVLKGNEFRWDRGEMYFFVPRGTKRFDVRITGGGRATLSVMDATGRKHLDVQNDKADQFSIDVPIACDNTLWSIQGPNHPTANAGFKLIGVPNYFTLDRERMLVPKETLPKQEFKN